MITEFFRKRDVTQKLIEKRVDSRDFSPWLTQMRFPFNSQEADVAKQLTMEMANARFFLLLSIFGRSR